MRVIYCFFVKLIFMRISLYCFYTGRIVIVKHGLLFVGKVV